MEVGKIEFFPNDGPQKAVYTFSGEAQPLLTESKPIEYLIVWNEGGRLMPFSAVDEAVSMTNVPSARCLPGRFPDKETAWQMIAAIERYIGELVIQDRLREK